MCVSVIKMYWTCFCAGVQHASVSLTVMCFVPDLWPVWRGGRCHSMTWRRYSLSPLHHPLPRLSNFSTHILLWVEFYAMALMAGRLEQDGNKATTYWNPERLNIQRDTQNYTVCLLYDIMLLIPVCDPPLWYHSHPPPPLLWLLSPMYILSIQSPTLETTSIIELLPSALLCNCHPTSALTFGGFVSKGKRHTHTQKCHLF